MDLQTYLPDFAFADCADDIFSSNHLVTDQVPSQQLCMFRPFAAGKLCVLTILTFLTREYANVRFSRKRTLRRLKSAVLE